MALLRIQGTTIYLALTFIVLLRILKDPQLVIPIRLERSRNQPVIGIDLQITALGEMRLCCVILRPIGF